MIEENLDRPLSVLIVSRLQALGKIEFTLKDILNCELFQNLSKHNPYWESEQEVEADKLYDIRCRLSVLEERLYDLMVMVQEP